MNITVTKVHFQIQNARISSSNNAEKVGKSSSKNDLAMIDFPVPQSPSLSDHSFNNLYLPVVNAIVDHQ